MIWVLLQMRRVAVDRLALESVAAGSDSGSGWLDRIFAPFADVEDAYAPQAGGLPAGPDEGTGTAAAYEGDAYGMDGDYTDYEDQPRDGAPRGNRPIYVPDFVMSIWHRLSRPSVLPDRSPLTRLASRAAGSTRWICGSWLP